MKKLMIIVLLLLITAPFFAQEPVDIYKRPVQEERSRDYDTEHYRISLTFDLENKKFWGENTITLKPLRNFFHECMLDAEELVVTGVTDRIGRPLPYEQTDRNLLVMFLEEYSYGQKVIFTVKYRATDPEKGLFFDDESHTNPRMVSTISWPDYAHHWFPCYDYPNDKVTADLIITVKEGYKVLSNGHFKGVTEDPLGETITYHWEQGKPHSTYLFMLAIAPYAVIQDSLGLLPVNYWVYPKDEKNARRVFKKTPEMIDYFNQIFGYTYPWAKYDQVISPRMGGGAENTSATLLGEGVITDEKAGKDFSWERIIAHEAAHQWWGDLITMRTWSDTWLSESFATYSDHLWTHHAQGDEEGAVDLLGKKNSYLKEAHTRYIRPIVFHRYNRPQDNFDAHTYPKGAAVLHMLRFILGDDAFFRTLRHFLHKHAFQVVDTQDFMTAVKETTGRNMDWFFDLFVFKPGHPVFDVNSTWKEGSNTLVLKVVQNQDTSKGVPVYRIPVIIGITTAEKKLTEKVWITKKEQIYAFSLDSKPLLVRFDEGNFLLKEWTFEKDEDELLYQLKNDDVIGRSWASVQLARFGKESAVVDALIETAQKDPFWAVRRSAVETLGSLKRSDLRDVFITFSEDNHSRVRVEVVRVLGESGDAGLLEFFRLIFETDDSYLVQAEALRSIGKCGDSSWIPFLEAASKLQSPGRVFQKAAGWAVKNLQDK